MIHKFSWILFDNSWQIGGNSCFLKTDLCCFPENESFCPELGRKFCIKASKTTSETRCLSFAAMRKSSCGGTWRIDSDTISLQPLSKTTHYGMFHFYWLPYRTDYPHQDSCIVVGLAHLYRQRFGLDRDWGVERWRDQRKYYQQTKSRTRMKNRIRSVWRQFKELFQKKDAKDMAMFHCSDCGNDFEAERHYMDSKLGDYGPTMTAITTIYCPSKCPKCGNWRPLKRPFKPIMYHVPRNNNIQLHRFWPHGFHRERRWRLTRMKGESFFSYLYRLKQTTPWRRFSPAYSPC